MEFKQNKMIKIFPDTENEKPEKTKDITYDKKIIISSKFRKLKRKNKKL